MKIPKYFTVCTLLVCFFCLSGCNLPTHIGLANPGEKTPILTSTAITIQSTSYTQQTSISTKTPIPTSTPELISGQWMASTEKLAIVYIDEDGSLDVFSQPGSDQSMIGQLTPDTDNIIPMGQFQWIGDELWLKIHSGNELEGWANAKYLTQQITSEVFCNDARVPELLNELKNTIADRDGNKLLKLTSPLHGLAIKHESWNPTIIFQSEEAVKNIFLDQTAIAWGIQDGSGLALEGSFKNVILPYLDEVFGDNTIHCNTLEQGLAAGGTTGFIQWPYEFSNFNYYSLYRSAPEGDDLNWRTWAVGVEYIENKPYLAVLVQYHWEI
jgi:hypothetical protein